MKTIYRYLLKLAAEQEIELPHDAQVLQLRACGGDSEPTIEMWCFVDTDAPPEQRRFRIVGTGHAADGIDPFDYVGSAVHQGKTSRFVWHVFDISCTCEELDFASGLMARSSTCPQHGDVALR